MSKSPKGSVVVCNRGKMLALQLPRYLFNSNQKYIYLGIPDTPSNRQAAAARAQIISADIAFDRFDYSLDKYKPTAIHSEELGLNELWEKYTDYKQKHLAHSTIDREFKRVASHLSKLPSDNLKSARKIRRHLIEDLSAATAKRVLMYVSACCQWGVEEDLIKFNPFKELPKIKAPKAKGIDPFTKAERDQIIAAFENNRYYKHYTGFVKFLFLTGCRPSEAIGLQWKHISSDLDLITFSEALVGKHRGKTKTKRIRHFPVNNQLKSFLLTIKPPNPQQEALVFPSPKNLAINPQNFSRKAWKSILDSLPIRYRSPYNTRHTFISLCLEEGIKINQIAIWAGNSPETIWKHYAGLISEQEVPEF